MNRNLTDKQNDYALFLPATSGFYAAYVGYGRRNNSYVPPNRIPANFVNGLESLNYLNPTQGLFYYQWCLYSAGHANLDLSKQDFKEDMFRTRDRKTSWVLGDSGGFQIGKGKWQADWKDPNCPKAQKKRSQVLTWMDSLMDYGMILDIPAWVSRSPEGQKATGITSYAEAVQGTFINNDYFIRNRNGNCKFLNVLQGENHSDADDWYQRMKHYCDPKFFPNEHFNGWAMGGQNMCDLHLTLKRLVALRFDGLLEEGKQDWMHFLGTSKLEWALLLTDIQRAVRKYHNANFTISFDCASPFLACANGQMYIQTETEDRKKWVYRMLPTLDNKAYAKDTRPFIDALLQDNIFSNVERSPILDGVKTNEICVYAPGDLNKIGRENKTSWDSFSYAILMGHNVWMHVNAVQEANRQYDAGLYPAMLVQEKFDRVYFKDVVDAIFSTSDRGVAEKIVDEFSSFWMAIPGTRGATGKRTVNASTNFAKFFDMGDVSSDSDDQQEFGDDDSSLDKLEELRKNE
jgi:hypothetical protein